MENSGPVSEIHVVSDDRYAPYQYKEHFYPNQPIFYMNQPRVQDTPPVSSKFLYMNNPVDDTYMLQSQGLQRQASDFSWGEHDTKPAAVPSSPKQSPTPTIELEPGVFLRLRGAVETQMAIQSGHFIATDCPCCTATICCIENADYVVCPDCRVVSPIQGAANDARSDGSVGLGFKFDNCL